MTLEELENAFNSYQINLFNQQNLKDKQMSDRLQAMSDSIATLVMEFTALKKKVDALPKPAIERVVPSSTLNPPLAPSNPRPQSSWFDRLFK